MYGIVLEGGGARGAYQIGVWRALKEMGLEYRGVAGTSVGALNGAMMVQGDLDRALDAWSGISPSQVLNIDEGLYERVRSLSLSHDDASNLLQAFKKIFREGMDTTPLRLLLGELIDENRIRASRMEFGFVTVSLSEWQPLKLYLEDVPEGSLIDYLLASTRLLIFKKERIDGKLMLDGGYYDNLPIDILANRGFNRIIAVRLGGASRIRWQGAPGVEVIYIKPGESLGGMLDFSRERACKNINLGYYDAQKVFKGYLGRRYYLDVDKDDWHYLQMLLHIDDERLTVLAADLGLPIGSSPKRLLLERLLPLIADLVNLGPAASYTDIVLSLLERAAEAAGIERFKIYRYDDFLGQVCTYLRRQRSRPAPVSLKLPRILKGNELVLRALREPVLDRFTEALVSSVQ